MDPGGVREDGPVFDVIVFHFSEPCRGYGPSIGKDGIVDSPPTGGFSKERYDVSVGEDPIHGDLIAGVGVKKVLPVKLLPRASEKVWSSVMRVRRTAASAALMAATKACTT
jgi:hypothetical protein